MGNRSTQSKIGDLEQLSPDLEKTVIAYAESIIEAVQEPLLLLTPELQVESINQAFCRQFQLVKDACLGRKIYDLGDGQWDIVELRRLLEKWLPEENVLIGCEIQHRFESIGERSMLVNACQLNNDRLILVEIRDITEQRRNEDQLRERENQYRTLFQAIDEGFCIFEVLFEGNTAVDYRFLETNAAFQQLTGLHDAVGKRMRDLRPLHEEHWFEVYGHVARTGKSERFAQQAKYLGNRWYDVYAFRVGQPEKKQVAVLFNDITDKKRALETLRESEERFRAVAELVPDLLWRSDPGGETTWYNQRWIEYTGQTLEQAVGYGWVDAIHPADQKRSRANYEAAVRNERSLQQEHRIRRHDGAYRWFLVRAEPVRDVKGKVRHWFGTATDVHDQRTAMETLEVLVERRTRQVRRLASRLTMAEQEERQRIARVLHDNLQQLLYGVQMRLRMIFRNLSSSGHELADSLDEATRWVQEAVTTTRRLTADLRPPILEKPELVEVVQWLQRQMKELYELDVSVESEHAFPVPNDNLRVFIFQSVRELLFNVVKHSGVTCATVRLEDSDGYLKIHVIDNGKGFDPAEVMKLEETGFGLFNIRERLRLIGGHVQVHSKPGCGTHVELLAPAASVREKFTK